MSDFLMVLLCAMLLAALPFALIWSLNVLFGLCITFTFKTWLAAAMVSLLLLVRNSS